MTRALVGNAADPAQVKEAKRLEREREKRYRSALERLAYTPDGEALFEQIAEYAAFYATSFDPNPVAMAYNEGHRALGLKLLADWTIARPDALAAQLAKRALEAKRAGAPTPPTGDDE